MNKDVIRWLESEEGENWSRNQRQTRLYAFLTVKGQNNSLFDIDAYLWHA